MARNLETDQEARTRKLARVHIDLLQIRGRWTEQGGPILSDDEEREVIEMRAEIAQLELQIEACREGRGRAVILPPWGQKMFPEIEIIPIDENEIPF